MLGFELDFWDYLTFAALVIAGVAGLVIVVLVAGLPGKIAIARKHPDAEAVQIMGYAGLPACGALDPGVHLGVQADRHRRHPAISRPTRRSPSTEYCALKGEPSPEQPAKPAASRLAPSRPRTEAQQGCCSASYCCSATRLLVWAVFFKFKWMKFNIAWAIVSVSVGLHLLIIFMIGLRFVTPLATEARIVQHTIQLTPRLSEPTLVTAVLVEPNVPVKKGQPLFQFDRRPYEMQVRQLEASLAQAKQDVLVMKADLDAATAKVSAS